MVNMANQTLHTVPAIGAFAQPNAAALYGAVLAIASFIIIFATLRKPISRVPGPWYSRWTGLVLRYHWVRGQRSIYVHKLHGKYGRIVRIGPDEVSLCDISALQAVYSARETFRKTPWYIDFVFGVENIFSTSSPDLHRTARRALAAPMADAAVHALAPRVAGHVDFAVQRMKAESETRQAVDIWKWWLFMTTDIIVELTFGESFHMLERGEVCDTKRVSTECLYNKVVDLIL